MRQLFWLLLLSTTFISANNENHILSEFDVMRKFRALLAQHKHDPIVLQSILENIAEREQVETLEQENEQLRQKNKTLQEEARVTRNKYNRLLRLVSHMSDSPIKQQIQHAINHKLLPK